MTAASELRVERHTRLGAADVEQVLDTIAAVADTDGVAPLSEHVMLHLRYGGDEPARSLLVRRDGQVAGYAHLDVTDAVEGPSAEVAVHPGHRGHGVGDALVAALLEESAGGRLRLWAHGEHSGAIGLATRNGFVKSRALWQMRRSLYAPLPQPQLPEGVAVRTFEVGRDEAAWLRVNARAFADHPEQGGWGPAELETREREPWFDPAGFFLAERDGELVGFHWTKVHGASHAHVEGEHRHDPDGHHAHEPIGEVYVVGVDPDAQGLGLGPALTVIGLRHLRGRGLTQVMLYVDESNTAAIRVYERLGFSRWDTDVLFRHG